jgi:hypothetical protein
MHPVSETMTKSFGADKNVNVPVASSTCTIRPVVRDNVPHKYSEPPTGTHINACSITTAVDSLRHFFTSKSDSPSEDGMAILIEFVLLQETDASFAHAFETKA